MGGNDKANAEHVVKCVNMHDELVKQLEYWENIVSNSTNAAVRESLQPWMGKTNDLISRAKKGGV